MLISEMFVGQRVRAIRETQYFPTDDGREYIVAKDQRGTVIRLIASEGGYPRGVVIRCDDDEEYQIYETDPDDRDWMNPDDFEAI
jgi:hypothetical protein